MILRTFEPEDLDIIVAQPAQAYMKPLVHGKDYGAILAQGEAWTGVREDGAIIACGGLVPMYAGIANAWMVIAGDLKHSFIHVHRIVRRALDISTFRRIEAHVDCGFVNGHRWARSLGFELEAERMRSFTPDGRDAALYARVR